MMVAVPDLMTTSCFACRGAIITTSAAPNFREVQSEFCKFGLKAYRLWVWRCSTGFSGFGSSILVQGFGVGLRPFCFILNAVINFLALVIFFHPKCPEAKVRSASQRQCMDPRSRRLGPSTDAMAVWVQGRGWGHALWMETVRSEM